MTSQKAFKRLVRERMTRTGERYAAARRALIGQEPSPASSPTAATHAAGGYRLLGGLHPETASVRNLLANRGLELTEAQVLGIGGGLGAGYILWEFQARSNVILTLGFRNRWQYPVRWLETMLARIGVEPEILETSGAKGAQQALDDLLDAGEPVIAFMDLQALGTWGLPDDLSGVWGLPVVVFGRREDGTYLVDDRGRAPLEIDPATMARARGRISSYKHRLIRIPRVDAPLTEDRLRAAYAAGLTDQVEHLRSTSDSFGLPAWRKWSRTIVDDRGPKGWRRVFEEPVGLFGTLVSIVEALDGGVGAFGGHLRELYATCLDDAAVRLDRPGLADAAAAWRTAADQWEEFADAAVPASLEGASEAVEAAEQLHDAVLAGEPGRAQASAAAERLWGLRQHHDREFVVPAAVVDRLFTDLSERLAAIHAAEIHAVEATAAGAGM